MRNFGELLKIYGCGVLRCNASDASDSSILNQISTIYSDRDFRKLYDDTQAEFCDISDIESEVSTAFGIYSQLFPSKTIPAIYTHVSGFSQSVVTSDSLVSVALDNYMGKDYPGYKGVFYNYQLKSKTKERITPDILKAWLYTEFPDNRMTKTLADGMIYEGSVLYTMGKMLPKHAIFELLNYNEEQISWCEENEKNIWGFILRSNHLYSSDAIIYAKYLNDAPYNLFFGKESPGELGKWLGYKIVSGYIDNMGEDKLLQLLSCQWNTIEVLKDSEYK
ncbi:MAG: hypothetical protein RR341_00755 [Bacteroidales bacterium]